AAPPALPHALGPAGIRGASSLVQEAANVIYTVADAEENKRGIFVASLAGKDPPRRLLPDLSTVAYVRSAAGRSGYLLFMRGGALLAQPFNTTTHELTLEPVRIVERVNAFSASESGAIVYRTGDGGRRPTGL